MYPYQNSFITRGIGNSLTKGLGKTLPFTTPKALSNVVGSTASKSLSLSTILNGAQKGINTLNQI